MERAYVIIDSMGDIYITANYCKTVEDVKRKLKEVLLVCKRIGKGLDLMTLAIEIFNIKLEDFNPLTNYTKISICKNGDVNTKYEISSYDLPIVLEVTMHNYNIIEDVRFINQITKSLYSSTKIEKSTSFSSF